MSKKRYVVELSADERKRLEELTRKGKSPAKKQLKARILLQADESPLGAKWNDPKISEALGTYPMMCARVRQQFAQGGMDAVLNRKQRATPPTPSSFGSVHDPIAHLGLTPKGFGRRAVSTRRGSRALSSRQKIGVNMVELGSPSVTTMDYVVQSYKGGKQVGILQYFSSMGEIKYYLIPLP